MRSSRDRLRHAAIAAETLVTLDDRRRSGDRARGHLDHARGDATPASQVPKLCATDSLEPFGSCRLCLVEIEGRRGTPASCTTPVEAGMKVAHPDASG